MNIEDTNLFQLASRRLQWLADRQRVVSENIANADTSEFRARDVQSFDSYLDLADGEALSPTAETYEIKGGWFNDKTGNNVVLEEQALLASETAGKYKVATNLYRKAHEMLLTVAGSR